jgi:hypothetical protein
MKNYGIGYNYRIVYISFGTLLSMFFCAWLSFNVCAQEPTLRERPRIPTQLDRATLQTYLDTIEEPRVASALKVGYFGGRGRGQGLPVTEGFALLKAAIAKEPVATKRWFYLQNVRGFAGFRNAEISPDEGFDAYSELFAQADKAKAAGTVYAVQTAVGDWVGTVSNRLARLRDADGGSLRDDERTAGVLLKAWAAYVSLLHQTEGRWNGWEPNWSQAIDRAGASDELVAAIEKTLADSQTPKTFHLLVAAATALRGSKPARALELFAQAKTLLPTDTAGKVDPRAVDGRRVTRFFEAWQELLQSEKKNAEAIATAQARVALLGVGYANLLRLQLDAKDAAGMAGTLKTLSAPDAPEREINAVAGVLSGLWDKNRASVALAENAVSLLQTFLQAPRERSLFAELEARWRLGWLLLEQKQNAKAKAALDLSGLQIDEKRLDSQSQFYLQNIRAMQVRLAAGR